MEKGITDMKERTFPRIVAFSIIAILILFGTHNRMFSYVALAITATYIVYYQEDEGFYLLFFLLNMANIFKPGPGSSSFFTLVVIIYVIKNTYLRKSLSPYVAFFICYILLTQFINGNNEYTLTIKLIANIMLIDIYNNKKDLINKDTILTYYVIGLLIASAMAFLDSGFFPIRQYSAVKELGTQYGFGEVYRYSGLDTDPNYYSVNVILAMCIIAELYYLRKNNLWKTILFLAIHIVFVVLTYSKSSIIMTIMPIVMILYSNRKTKRYAAQIGLVGLVCVVLAFMLSGSGGSLFKIVFERFSTSGGDINSLTTGRYALWQNYIEYLKNNFVVLLFGVGIGGPLVANNMAPHNTYIDLVYFFGIIGTTLFFVAIRSFQDNKRIKKNIINYSVSVCLILMYFFLSELYYYDSVFHLIIAKMFLSTDFGINENQNNVIAHYRYLR